tara:strand:- start:19284 stop:20648 length:1365 start_codon:yes stop_codon:yes gene_type:complete
MQFFSRFIVLILTGLLIVPTLDAQLPQINPSALVVPHRLLTLKNGLTVILHQDSSVPVVSVNIWYHVGSANEKSGRTGFAHLFEHLMFEGSANVSDGEFDALLEAAGGSNNGSTTTDRTNYYEDVPSNALELALFLESDRMGHMLAAMSPARVDRQREVVKNERRQNYENRPYGMAFLELNQALYPSNHPYSWPTIGHMEDLNAATYEDVVEFFKTYYVPNNATLVVAGDINLDDAEALVLKWFSEIPKGNPVDRITVPTPRQTALKKTITDRVQLSRLYLAWLSPATYKPGDAALDVAGRILAEGKNSKLYRRLVYDKPLAQNVSAFQQSAALSGSFQIIATARPGISVADIKDIIDEELDQLRQNPPGLREVQQAVNQIEASFYRQMERVGGYRGKAEQLNAYYFATGNPDYFAEDLARYTALTPSDIQAAITEWLSPDQRVEIIVQPEDAR